MMYGYGSGFGGGLGLILWFLVVIDLALLGVWLWQNVKK